MIAGLIGSIIGFCIGLYLGCEIKGDANTTIIRDLTIKLNAQDIIDIQDSENEVDELKKELGL